MVLSSACVVSQALVVPRLALAGGLANRTPRDSQRSVTDGFASVRSTGATTARSAFGASAYSFRSMHVRHITSGPVSSPKSTIGDHVSQNLETFPAHCLQLTPVSPQSPDSEPERNSRAPNTRPHFTEPGCFNELAFIFWNNQECGRPLRSTPYTLTYKPP